MEGQELLGPWHLLPKEHTYSPAPLFELPPMALEIPPPGPRHSMISSTDTAPVPERLQGPGLPLTHLAALRAWHTEFSIHTCCRLWAMRVEVPGGSPASESELAVEGPGSYLLVLA